MDLSLRIEDDTGEGDGCGSGVGRGGEISGSSSSGFVEREHMFDKVVTPSDVGKLNRLVIPKQHAEKYFPLDSASNEKGLILNFEDRNGKSWRFRYSYWNSSQSYVMTKGWSRFVKEKKLDAGDVVSFQRGVGELGKDRLYIDWRCRPNALPNPISLAHLHLQNQPRFPPSVRYVGRPYPGVPSLMAVQNFGTHPAYYNNNEQLHRYQNMGSASFYFLRPSVSFTTSDALQQRGNAPMVIDSVPVGKSSSTSKRLRLFGVNMECNVPEENGGEVAGFDLSASAAIQQQQVVTVPSLSPPFPGSSLSSFHSTRLPNGVAMPTNPAELSGRRPGKGSLYLDWDSLS